MTTKIKQRPYCDIRASMFKNPLLVRNKIGHHTPSTHKLPPEDYTYGMVYPQGEGVKDMFDNWALVESGAYSARANKNYRPQQDFIATNKAAIKAGCVTPREIRKYQMEHPIMQKQEVKNEGQETPEQFHNRVTQMVHGIHTPYVSEMEDCLTFKTGREAKERALAKRQREMERMSLKTAHSRKNITQRSMRPTRASLGHQYIAHPPEKPSDTFKMKRFLEIDHYAIDDKWD